MARRSGRIGLSVTKEKGRKRGRGSFTVSNGLDYRIVGRWSTQIAAVLQVRGFRERFPFHHQLPGYVALRVFPVQIAGEFLVPLLFAPFGETARLLPVHKTH